MNDRHATRLDAAVIAVDRFVHADRLVGKTAGSLLVCEQFDILAQRPLVALQRQDVVGLLVDDLPRNLALASDRIDGDDGALDRQHVEQGGNGDNLARLVADLGLRQHETLSRRESRHRCEWRPSIPSCRNGGTFCRRWRSDPPASWSAPQLTPRCNVGRLGRPAWRKYRPSGSGSASRLRTGGSGAVTRASSRRSARCR